MSRMSRVLPLILAATLPAWSSLDLAQLWSSTVQVGSPSYGASMRLDSARIRVHVAGGVASTHLDMSYTPVDTAGLSRCTPGAPCRQPWMDSLETRTWFSLDPSAAITEMWLWVGEDRERAYIQDRVVAHAQYQEIVGARLDPALLQAWGGGQYDLAVFPDGLGKTRRLEIEMHQPVLTPGQMMLPVTWGGPGWRQVRRGPVTVEIADDLGNRWTLQAQDSSGAWVDLGTSARFSDGGALPALRLAHPRPVSVWGGGAPGKLFFGTSVRLARGDLDFEAAPGSLIVVLDAAPDTSDAALLERSRKLFLLALATYGTVLPTTFYVRDARGDLQTINPAPTDSSADSQRSSGPRILDREDLEAAVRLIRSTSVPQQADPFGALHRALAHHRSLGGERTNIVLVSTESHQHRTAWPSRRDVELQERWMQGYRIWEDSLQGEVGRAIRLVSADRSQLFTISRSWQLSQIAIATAGYQLASLWPTWTYEIPRTVERMPGITTLPVEQETREVARIPEVLPPLHGQGRNDGSVPTIDTVVVVRGLVDSMAVQQMNLVHPMPMMNRMIAIDCWRCYNPRVDTLDLSLAGQSPATGAVALEIRGSWGGLGFSHRLDLDVPGEVNGSRAAGALWAGAWIGSQTGLSWEDGVTLGKAYHVATPFTSLLALEPGMQLWDSIPVLSRTQESQSLTADSRMAAPSSSAAQEVESASLETLLQLIVASARPVVRTKPVFHVRTGPGVAFEITGGATVDGALLVVDLSGTVVARVALTRHESTARGFWSPEGRHGVFLAVALVDGVRRVERFMLPGR